MAHDHKNEKAMMGPQKMALYNMVFAEAIFELLTEKGILTGDEVLERVKRLKSETQIQFRWVQ